MTGHTQFARKELIPELKNALCEAGLPLGDPPILELAVLQLFSSSPDEIPPWSVEYQRGLLDGDLAHLLQEVQAAFAHLAEPAGLRRAYYLLELWVYRGGLRALDLGASPDLKAEFENLRDDLRVTHDRWKVELIMGPHLRMSRAYNAAQSLTRNLGVKNWQEWNA